MTVKNILNEIRNAQLRERIPSDLELATYDQKKEVNGFMEQAINLSHAFYFV